MMRLAWTKEAGKQVPTLDGQPICDGDALELLLDAGRSVRGIVVLTESMRQRKSLALELRAELAGGGAWPFMVWVPSGALLQFSPMRPKREPPNPGDCWPFDEGGAYVGR